jgi:hypothetical protein
MLVHVLHVLWSNKLYTFWIHFQFCCTLSRKLVMYLTHHLVSFSTFWLVINFNQSDLLSSAVSFLQFWNCLAHTNTYFLIVPSPQTSCNILWVAVFIFLSFTQYLMMIVCSNNLITHLKTKSVQLCNRLNPSDSLKRNWWRM